MMHIIKCKDWDKKNDINTTWQTKCIKYNAYKYINNVEIDLMHGLRCVGWNKKTRMHYWAA
jgi:hypothetical protein